MASERVSQEDIQEAMRRYPGIPMPLAVARFKLWQQLAKDIQFEQGIGFGGLHEEDIPEMINRFVQHLLYTNKRSFTLKVEVEGYPEDYTHYYLEVLEVE